MSSEAMLEHRRFTADEVARMVEAGILREDEPVELIAGELIVVSPQGPLHSTIIQRLNQRLSLIFGSRAHTRIQFPIQVPPHGLPEPDLAVVRGAIDDYARRHPSGDDVILQPDTKTARYSVTTILDDTRQVDVPETQERIAVAELLKR
jgi:Uma2 family endonuclease